MNKIQGRVTISKYASKQDVIIRNEELLQQYLTERWNFPITRLYSKVQYSEGEYKLENHYCQGRNKDYQYDLEKTLEPIHASSFNIKSDYPRSFYNCKFYIAVKELIIEWEDYQAEIAGYVYCKACENLKIQMAPSSFFVL